MESEFTISTEELGDPRYYWVKVFPIIEGKAARSGTVSIVLDITAYNNKYKKTISDMEKLSAQNTIKCKLIEVVTHDIKGPMATLTNLMAFLEEDKEKLSNENREIFLAIKDQIDYTYDLVENTLEWVRINRKRLTYNPLVWNIFEIIQDAVYGTQTQVSMKKINLYVEIDERLKVYAARDMVYLVFKNILNNAVKFTERGGSVFLKAERNENMVTVAIEDTGMGIDPEKSKLLFSDRNPSTPGTSGEKGSGLGLLICKDFVTFNAGKIWASSIPGKGSTFYISLPSAEYAH